MIKVNASLGRCGLSIVGLGWGGIYAAWRLAIDAPPEKRIDPRTICLFEVRRRNIQLESSRMKHWMGGGEREREKRCTEERDKVYRGVWDIEAVVCWY